MSLHFTIMSDMSEQSSSLNSLLSIIDTLYKKVEELNVSLWIAETTCIENGKQIMACTKEIENLKECISHRDDEIRDITFLLDHVSSESNYFDLLETKKELEQKYDILQKEHTEMLRLFCDVEYTL